MKSPAQALAEFKMKRAIPEQQKKGMGLAHFSVFELEWMNVMQGGESLDEETGYPEYSKLGPIFKKPAVRRFFLDLKAEAEIKGRVNPVLEKVAAQLRDHPPRFINAHPKTAKEEMLKKEGIGEDTQMALVPFTVLDFFDELRGGTKINPHDGLPMYLFDKIGKIGQAIVRVGLPVAAAVLSGGNPLVTAGAAALAHGATGNRDPMSILKNSALAGGAAWGAGHLGAFGAAGAGAPVVYAGTGLGSAKSMAAYTAAKTAATAGTGVVGGAAASAAAPSLLSQLSTPAAILGGASILANVKGGQSKKEEVERQYQEDKKEHERKLRASGRYIPLTPDLSPYEHLRKREEHRLPELHLKTGGVIQGKPIKGPGNGQDDLIKVDSTKEGEWIWDASTVADLGDGSTDAGWKEIKRLENRIKRKPGFKEMHEFKPGIAPQKVKTALSNGEFRTPTKIVTAIGDGDNTRGANILRRMTQNIRIYKNSNGHQLPPPIKDPMRFFTQAVHQEMR